MHEDKRPIANPPAWRLRPRAARQKWRRTRTSAGFARYPALLALLALSEGSSPASPSLSAERHGRDRFPFPRTDRRASRQFHTSDAARAVLRTADRVPAQRDNPVYLLLVSGASNEVFLQRLGPNHGHESNDCADHCRKRRKSRQEENQLAIAAGNLGAHPPSQGHSASWLTPRSHEPCGWAGPPGF